METVAFIDKVNSSIPVRHPLNDAPEPFSPTLETNQATQIPTSYTAGNPLPMYDEFEDTLGTVWDKNQSR